ncbi:MAG: glycerol kinase GlpK [Pseudomonadota bacterium]
MPNQYILAIDQGTSSSRCILFDQKARLVAKSQQALPQSFPNPDRVEHDPEAIWQTVLRTMREVVEIANIQAQDIVAIGISNQRETTLIWDRETGESIYPAIVWQDRRTSDYCQQRLQYESTIQQKTGLLLNPYFSASKIAWLLDNVDGARRRAENGELAFGTVDTFLLWRLSNGQSHYTDVTNASRTLLYNINTQQWDDDLLALFNIPPALLPQVKDNCFDFGMTDPSLLGVSIPITAMAGDQQAALFGQTCFSPGLMKSTYGTGCFMLLNTGDQIMLSRNKLLSTIAYRINGKISYALEGSIFMAGAIVDWLQHQLGVIKSAQESERLASQLSDNGGVYLIPAFTGLGAPYWRTEAKAAIIGMTRNTNAAHIARAGLEAIVYQTFDLLRTMMDDGAVLPDALHVDGGMIKNNWLMQFLADIIGMDVKCCAYSETTALGAAFLAGLHCQCYASMDELTQLWQVANCFTSNMLKQQRQQHYQQWCELIKKYVLT